MGFKVISYTTVKNSNRTSENFRKLAESEGCQSETNSPELIIWGHLLRQGGLKEREPHTVTHTHIHIY